jgi:hypothetical protein
LETDEQQQQYESLIKERRSLSAGDTAASVPRFDRTNTDPKNVFAKGLNVEENGAVQIGISAEVATQRFLQEHLTLVRNFEENIAVPDVEIELTRAYIGSTTYGNNLEKSLCNCKKHVTAALLSLA